METTFDFKRIKSALLQQHKNFAVDEVGEIIEKFSCLINLLGEYSLARPMITKICNHIILKKRIDVIVPVCPDYSHENGIYTLNTVESNISLVAQKHMDFLIKVNHFIPIQALFLFANYEIEDESLLNKIGLNKSEFLKRIISSSEKCHDEVKNLNWSSSLMTHVILDIEEKEKQYTSEILSQENYKRQIEYDTLKRKLLYDKINPDFTWEEKMMRTVRTASQYYTLGLYAKTNDLLICNHTTTNLAWYVKSGAGLLHNPIVIY